MKTSSILKEIESSKLESNDVSNQGTIEENIGQKDYPYPLFTNKRKNPEDEIASEMYANVNLSELELSVRAVNVLEKAKITTINDLLLYSSDQLIKLPNCGNKTVNEFMSKCKKFLENYNPQKKTTIRNSIPVESLIKEYFTFETLRKLPIFSNKKIDQENQNLHSSFYGSFKLSDIPFNVRTVNAFDKLKLDSIKDLLFYPYTEILITAASGKKTIENIQNKLTNFYKVIYTEKQKFHSFYDMLSKILEVKPSNLQVFFERLSSFGKDATLESIGNRYNITRERVRQIVNKIEELFKYPFIEMQFEELFEAVNIVIDQYIKAVDVRIIIKDFSDLLEWNDIVFPEIIANFCSINNKYEINKDYYLIFSNSKKCKNCTKFIDFIKAFFISNDKISLIELNSQFKLICQKDCMSFSETKQIDNQFIKWLFDSNEDLSSICVFDEEENCYCLKSIWEEKNKPQSMILLEILEQQANPLHMNEFAVIVNNQLCTDYTPNQVSNLVLNSKGAYLWDRGTVYAKSNFNYPTEFIDSFIEYIINLLENDNLPVLYINGLYTKFEKECKKFYISNTTALYSLLRERNDSRLNLIKYPDIYLNSVNRGRSNITNEIIRLLKKFDGAYDYKDLREYFIETLHAADYIFQSAIAGCDKIEKIDSIVRIIDKQSQNSEQHTQAEVEFLVIDYIELANKKGIELSSSEYKILEELMKRNGSLTFLRIDIFSKRQGIDLNSAMFSLNSKFYSLFGKELVIKDQSEEIWEINYYFNNPSNWQLDSDEPENIETSENNESKKDNYFESTDLNDDFDKLDHILDRTATSYKIYWFQALLYLIENNILEASFMDMAVLMCAFAWQDVLKDKYEYPKIDKIPDIIKHIYVESDLSKSSTFEEVKDYLHINQNLYVDQLTSITLYVPYRFLNPFIEGVKDLPASCEPFKRNVAIAITSQNMNLIYKIIENSVILNSKWCSILNSKNKKYEEISCKKKKDLLKLNV